MDLVDIDALLGDLELEADNSTSPTSTSQKQTANGHSSSISQLSSISMTSNGHPASVANGNAAASNGVRDPPNFMDDLLDLNMEPDFSPALSSMQRNTQPPQNKTFPLSNMLSNDNLNKGQPHFQHGSINTNNELQAGFGSNQMPSTHSMPAKQPDLLSASSGWGMPDTFLEKGRNPPMPDIMTSSGHSDDLLGGFVSQAHRSIQQTAMSQHTDWSSDHWRQEPSSNVTDAAKVGRHGDTTPMLLPDLTFTKSTVTLQSGNTYPTHSPAGSNRPLQPITTNNEVGGFLPLTEDLDFLTSYEAQRNMAQGDLSPLEAASPSKQSMSSVRSNKAEPTAPSLGQFSSEFGLPSPTPLNKQSSVSGSLTQASSPHNTHTMRQESNHSSIIGQSTGTPQGNSLLSSNGVKANAPAPLLSNLPSHGDMIHSLQSDTDLEIVSSNGISRPACTQSLNPLLLANNVIASHPTQSQNGTPILYSFEADINSGATSTAQPLSPPLSVEFGQDDSLNFSIPSNHSVVITSNTPPLSLLSQNGYALTNQPAPAVSNVTDRSHSMQQEPDIIPDIPDNQRLTLPSGDPPSGAPLTGHQTINLDADQLQRLLVSGGGAEDQTECAPTSLDDLRLMQSSVSPTNPYPGSNFSALSVAPDLQRTPENHPSVHNASLVTESLPDIQPSILSQDSGAFNHTPDVQPSQQLSHDEEEFNSLLAANGYPLSNSDKVMPSFPQARGPLLDDAGFGAGADNSRYALSGNAYSSPTGSVSSLQKYRMRTSSVDSFTRMSYQESQPSVDSFTALHNLAQMPRNSLLEQNGIIPTVEDDMGWDVGTVPTSMTESTDRWDTDEDKASRGPEAPAVNTLLDGTVQQATQFSPDLMDAAPSDGLQVKASARQPITEDDYLNIWESPVGQTTTDSYDTAHLNMNHGVPSWDGSSSIPGRPVENGFFTATTADDILNDIGISEPYEHDELPPGSLPTTVDPVMASLGEGFVAEDVGDDNFVMNHPTDDGGSRNGSVFTSEAPVGGAEVYFDPASRPSVPTPSTADLQAMVVQDDIGEEEESRGVENGSHPGVSEHHDHSESPPPAYQLIDPAEAQNGPGADEPTQYDQNPNDQHTALPPDQAPDPALEYMDLGATQPYWIPDADSTVCMLCNAKFTLTKRRHHCRSCGKLFCGNCCSMKSKLQYMDFKEAKVCKTCHEQIAMAAEQQARLLSEQAASPDGHSGSHPQQEAGAVGGAEAVAQRPAVPTGVLKDTTRPSSTSSSREANRSVIFADGIRPGDENSNIDGSDVTPSSRVRRKNKNRQKTNQRLRETLRNTFLIPETSLPPLLCYDNDSSHYSAVDTEPDELGLISKLREEGEDGRFAFAIHKDLNVGIKIVKMDCCTGKQCWCFTSNGLNTVSQDEIVFVLLCEPDENRIPRDVFHLFKMLYQHAAAGQQVNELGYVDLSKVQPFNETGFLGNKDLTSLMFIRSTFQCSKGLHLPSPPFLYAILIHKLELPWAKLFPLRLKLRLGAEFKYYPCPLMSVRDRGPVYKENTNTIMNLLADFQSYQYTLTKIEGFTVHLTDKVTTISIPKNMYSTIMKVVGASQECVIAFGASFSQHADSHIVCMQNEDGRYTSSTMNISNQVRSVTGASFVVFSGSMKESGEVSAKCSIVEDGIMVQITKEALDQFKAKLTNMQEYTVTCGRSPDNSEASEEVKIVWVDDYKDYNIGVNSPIDDFPMDGVMSLRVKSFNDLTHDTYTIRWTEVFFVQVDETRLTIDAMEITQFSETLANSTCVALAPYLQSLHQQDMKKIALRVTLGPEQVEYISGSSGQRLAPDIMNSLDSELVPVLHSAVSLTSGTLLVLELIFHVLE